MLNICKASAGSGKTHRLTGEYLKMLFSTSSSVKDGYKTILAVTFTNKATDEMKQRILDELYLLTLPNGKSLFLDGIMKLPRINALPFPSRERYVHEQARAILVEILNDYSLFNISTIDRFFQQTLRAFAREVGQYSSYNVELDSDSILVEAVDTMMDSLEDNKDLLDWMIQLSVDAIEKGESWNTMPKLLHLGGELFSEEFKIKSRGTETTLRDKVYIGGYRDRLLSIINDFAAKSKSIGGKAMKMLSDAGLSPSDFPYGAASGMQFFAKMASGVIETPGKRFCSMSSGVDSWYSKSASKSFKAVVSLLYAGGMSSLYDEAMTLYSDTEDYYTAQIILRDLFVLGIMYDIYGHVSDYCRKKNLVILSEATDMLNRIIDGSDTPFIYEKIGGRINHYMLDEFQDTSVMQWDNFRPLIKDSIDSGYEDLIVGDVKQSIYRWRSSDWSLLNSGINKEFDPRKVHCDMLDSNWRSLGNVVKFNNLFFERAGKVMQDKFNSDLPEAYSAEFGSLITGIYSTVAQEIPKKEIEDVGHVCVTYMENDDDSDWRTKVKLQLPDTINTLISNGYRKEDIAILVRTNADGSELANLLLETGFNIISEDSLFISSSRSVRKIVNTLKFISQPEDTIAKYLQRSEFVDPKELSLYDICEEIIRTMTEEERSEGTFIQAFLDTVVEYASHNGSDLRGFIRWWDEVGRKRSISAPEGEDAIRILTIHKSKGLGFKVVVIPFMNESFFRSSGDILWCRPEKAPFDMLPLIPVRLTSALTGTIFAEDFYREKLYSYVDVLNLAYVAFTRAKEELIIFSQKPVDASKLNNMSDLLFSLNAEEMGSWCIPGPSSEKLVSDIEDRGAAISIPLEGRLKVSLSGHDFFDEESSRQKGIVLHDILSRVSVAEDLEGSVKVALAEGVISDSDFSPIYAKLSGMLSSVSSRHWFDGTYSQHNEISILTPSGDDYRPDRLMLNGDKVIVVDYKFGKNHMPSYYKQVQGYMELLRRMGYCDVCGYLWYLDGIEEVSL